MTYKPPIWVTYALRGITYWIGHRRCLYHGHSLPEGALVAEICNLIHAHLHPKLSLRCEVKYSKLLPLDSEAEKVLKGKRTDLVIVEKAPSKNGKIVPKYIIEVKREVAGKTKIYEDLQRLAEARRVGPHIQTFLFVISETHRPPLFVKENGTSPISGRERIPKSGGYFEVKKIWKAAGAFGLKKRDNAHYACLIEVYPSK